MVIVWLLYGASEILFGRLGTVNVGGDGWMREGDLSKNVGRVDKLRKCLGD